MAAVAYPEAQKTTTLRKAWLKYGEGSARYSTWTGAARRRELDRFGVFKPPGGRLWICPDPPPREMLDFLAEKARHDTPEGKIRHLPEAPGMGVLHSGFWREYQDSLQAAQDLRRRVDKAEQRAERAEQRADRAQERLIELLEKRS